MVNSIMLTPLSVEEIDKETKHDEVWNIGKRRLRPGHAAGVVPETLQADDVRHL